MPLPAAGLAEAEAQLGFTRSDIGEMPIRRLDHPRSGCFGQPVDTRRTTALTQASPIAHTLAVSARKKLGAIVLLMVAAALPESVWLGVHALAHHDHEDSAGHDHEAAEAAQIAELATVLVHRHAHDGNVPDHEHHLAPAPASREASPRRCDSARATTELRPATGGTATGGARIVPETRPQAAGSGPPLLALLCTLRV